MSTRTVELALATPGLDAAGRPTRVPLGVAGVEPGDERMLVNLGPQHPATHGVLRLVVELEGETVRRIIPHIGYLHSGFEKLGEYRHYNQIVPLTDRTDYLSPMANNVGFALGAEKLMVLTDVEGLYRDWPDSDDVIQEISPESLAELMPTLDSGMVPKMQACYDAVSGGVPRATVVDGREPHAVLLELFTAEGVGTQVLPGVETRLRKAYAKGEDS